MGRRTELTLVSLLVLALAGVGFLAWGQYTGRFTFFGDTFLSSADVTSLVINPSPIETRTTGGTYHEEFITPHYLDGTQTTAFWNTEAGEVNLLPGTKTGRVQSTTFSQLTGTSVRVRLDATEERVVGNTMFYAISSDGGTTWQPVFSGVDTTIMKPAGDWQWRAVLNRGDGAISPAIQTITIQLDIVA